MAWSAGSPVQGEVTSPARSGNPGKGPVAQLNEKARAVKDGDTRTTREMVDEVFRTVTFGEASASLMEATKERLQRAEISYRNGKQEGIQEINVVRVVNGLALKFKAPEYAKTSQYEVRTLRLAMLPLLPDFIAVERFGETGEEARIGSTIPPQMSPTEAVFVTLMLLQQKLSNPEYQMTHAERVSRWAEKHRRKEGDSQTVPRREDTARQEEMQQVMERGIFEMAAAELSNLPTRALDILDVQK
jgi:hypothetical protein